MSLYVVVYLYSLKAESSCYSRKCVYVIFFFFCKNIIIEYFGLSKQ